MFQRTLISQDVLQKKGPMVKKVGEHFTLYTALLILAHNSSEKLCSKYALLNFDLFLTSLGGGHNGKS